MTRSTKSMFSMIGVVVAMATAAVPAMAGDYGSLNSIVGDGPSASQRPSDDYSSVSALVGDGGQAPAPVAETTFATSSPNAILGSDGLGEPTGSPVSSSSSEGFDWGDAAIGSAVGLGLAAMLGVAFTVARRRRPRMQPSV